MSEEMATDPELILPPPLPISVAEALLSSIRPLDRNPTPPAAEPADELNQLQSMAVFPVLVVDVLEGTTTAAEEDFRNRSGLLLSTVVIMAAAIVEGLLPLSRPLELCERQTRGEDISQ